MRIGFDAKWFFSGNPSGRLLVRNYLEQLIRTFPEHDYFIFLRRADRDRQFPRTSPRVHLIYCGRGNNLVSNLLVIPWKARKLNLDVALFQYFAPFCRSFKTVVFVHDIIFKAHPEYFTLWERLYFWPMKFLARRADRVVTISQTEKKRIVEFRFASEAKVDVVYLGVDPKFKPREFQDPSLLHTAVSRFNLPDRFLLYVGRLNERKNISNLLRAVKRLKDRKIGLVLAGMPQGRMFDLKKRLRIWAWRTGRSSPDTFRMNSFRRCIRWRPSFVSFPSMRDSDSLLWKPWHRAFPLCCRTRRLCARSAGTPAATPIRTGPKASPGKSTHCWKTRNVMKKKESWAGIGPDFINGNIRPTGS